MVSYDVPRDFRVPAREGLALRAAQDRDLLAEAADEDACVGAALEVVSILYPPIHLGPACRVLPITN